MTDTTYRPAPVTFLSLLFLLFLGLKLGGVIDWSWWWVTAPIWMAWTFALVVLVPVILFFHHRATKKRKVGGV